MTSSFTIGPQASYSLANLAGIQAEFPDVALRGFDLQSSGAIDFLAAGSVHRDAVEVDGGRVGFTQGQVALDDMVDSGLFRTELAPEQFRFFRRTYGQQRASVNGGSESEGDTAFTMECMARRGTPLTVAERRARTTDFGCKLMDIMAVHGLKPLGLAKSMRYSNPSYVYEILRGGYSISAGFMKKLELTPFSREEIAELKALREVHLRERGTLPSRRPKRSKRWSWHTKDRPEPSTEYSRLFVEYLERHGLSLSDKAEIVRKLGYQKGTVLTHMLKGRGHIPAERLARLGFSEEEVAKLERIKDSKLSREALIKKFPRPTTPLSALLYTLMLRHGYLPKQLCAVCDISFNEFRKVYIGKSPLSEEMGLSLRAIFSEQEVMVLMQFVEGYLGREFVGAVYRTLDSYPDLGITAALRECGIRRPPFFALRSAGRTPAATLVNRFSAVFTDGEVAALMVFAVEKHPHLTLQESAYRKFLFGLLHLHGVSLTELARRSERTYSYTSQVYAGEKPVNAKFTRSLGAVFSEDEVGILLSLLDVDGAEPDMSGFLGFRVSKAKAKTRQGGPPQPKKVLSPKACLDQILAERDQTTKELKKELGLAGAMVLDRILKNNERPGLGFLHRLERILAPDHYARFVASIEAGL